MYVKRKTWQKANTEEGNLSIVNLTANIETEIVAEPATLKRSTLEDSVSTIVKSEISAVKMDQKAVVDHATYLKILKVIMISHDSE